MGVGERKYPMSLLAATFAVGLIAGWYGSTTFRPQAASFEECLLSTMKGQAKSLMSVATRLCRSRFPEPVQSSPNVAEPKVIVPDPNAEDLSKYGTPLN
jgi:hypothetical protein